MQLHVKNMVCNRCITAVAGVFEAAGMQPGKIDLGVVEVSASVWDSSKLPEIKERLRLLGFELIDDKKSTLIEMTKAAIVKQVHHEDLSGLKVNWSSFLADTVGHDYKSLSQLFSSVEGTTIEQFIILQKIEKVKELLVYNELTLSEIAWKLGYSSVAHLSSQFKKVTGMAPKFFKGIGEQRRKPLDRVNGNAGSVISPATRKPR